MKNLEISQFLSPGGDGGIFFFFVEGRKEEEITFFPGKVRKNPLLTEYKRRDFRNRQPFNCQCKSVVRILQSLTSGSGEFYCHRTKIFRLFSPSRQKIITGP